MKKLIDWYMGLSNCCRVVILLMLFLAGMFIGMMRADAAEVGAFTTSFDQQDIIGLQRDSDNVGMVFGHTWEDDVIGVGIDGYLFNNSNGQDVYLQWRAADRVAFRAGVGRMGSHATATVDVNGVPAAVTDTDRADTRWIQAVINVHDNAAVFLRITRAKFNYNFTATRSERHHRHHKPKVYTGTRTDAVEDTYVWFGVLAGF